MIGLLISRLFNFSVQAEKIRKLFCQPDWNIFYFIFGFLKISLLTEISWFVVLAEAQENFFLKLCASLAQVCARPKKYFQFAKDKF